MSEGQGVTRSNAEKRNVRKRTEDVKMSGGQGVTRSNAEKRNVKKKIEDVKPSVVLAVRKNGISLKMISFAGKWKISVKKIGT